MKILLVANGVSRAGTSRVLSLLSQEWSKNHQIEISLFRAGYDAYPIGGKVIQDGIPMKGCVFSQIYHLYKLLKTNQFDRIIGFSEDANYPLAIASKLAKASKMTTLTVHNPVQKFSSKVKKRVSKYYPGVNNVFGVSEGVCKGLIGLGISAEKTVFRPNPIDLDAVDEMSNLTPEVLLNEERETVKFISVGRLHKDKGFDLLLKAFRSVIQKIPNAKLWIIGEGKERFQLETIIESLDLAAHVVLLGERKNPFAIVKQADIYVMSSRLEGWPLVLMEAMATSRPVIAFNCPNGPDEIIQNSSQGVLVECGNVELLANEMISLSKDSVRQFSLGTEGRHRIEAFNVKTIARLWLE